MIEDCKKIAPLLFIWLAVSTIVYLHIFWSSFSVNPIDYISVGEIINYAGHYFFAAAGVSIFIGGFELLFPKYADKGSFGSDLVVIRVSVLAVVLCGGLSIYLKESYPAISAGLYASLVVMVGWLSRIELAKKYLKTHSVRLSALIFICLSPYFAITESVSKSRNIINEINVKKVHLRGIEGFTENEVVYVGKLGEYTFYKKIGSNRIFEVKSDEIKYKEHAL